MDSPGKKNDPDWMRKILKAFAAFWRRFYRPTALAGKTARKKFTVEIFFSFFLLDCVNFIFFPADPAFLKFALHPYWIAILLMASRYGFGAGLATSLAACAHIFIVLFEGVPSKARLEMMVESRQLVLPVAFIFVGMFIGEMRQKHMDAEKKTQDFLKIKDEEIRIYKDRVDATEKARRVLEARIVGQTTTVKTLYDAARKFESLSVQAVYSGCLDILTKYLGVEKASVYALEGNYFVLKESQGWEPDHMAEGKIPRDKTVMSLAIRESRPMSVKDVVANAAYHEYIEQFQGLLAVVPILSGERASVPLGVVNIEKMDFYLFNKPTLALIEMVADWTGRALQKIRFYENARAKQVTDEEYDIFNFSHFQNVLEQEFLRAQRFKLGLAVALVKLDQFGFFESSIQTLLSQTIVALMKRTLDRTDMIFRYRFEGIFAVIAPMKKARDLEKVFEPIRTEFLYIFDKATLKVHPKLLVAAVESSPGMTKPFDMVTAALKLCGLASLTSESPPAAAKTVSLK